MSRSKYGAKPTTIDNIRFASQAEARRYQELKLLEKARQIQYLSVQPSFDLHSAVQHHMGAPVRMQKVARYVADFKYQRRSIAYPDEWVWVFEDVKGMKTPMYRLKKKRVFAQYGIEIQEI